MVRFTTGLCLWVIPAALASPFAAISPKRHLSLYPVSDDNVVEHSGGRGPYMDRESVGIDRDAPAGCSVDQVIMIKRHGERYPAKYEAKPILDALQKVRKATSESHHGDLAFVRNWTYYVPDDCYEVETTTGSHAGLLDAYNHGREYRERYGGLWDEESTLPLFASDLHRVIDTARHFGEGFFGTDEYLSKAALNIISESTDRGADSLTPKCRGSKPASEEICHGWPHDLPQFHPAAERLNAQYPGLDLDWKDVLWLMTMAAYELNVRDHSEWIKVFTMDEWVNFDYAWGMSFYYCSGPGNEHSRAVGAVYANASLTMLNDGPSPGNHLVFNFAHDDNITPIITSLGIVNPAHHLPVDQISFTDTWPLPQLVPMGGRLTIERLHCDASALGPGGPYVRLVLNEAVVPFRDCVSGPGYSCPLGNYTEILSSGLPDFAAECAVPPDEPQYLDFWWKYSGSNAANDYVSKELQNCHPIGV